MNAFDLVHLNELLKIMGVDMAQPFDAKVVESQG